jgi:hypothetical protein
MTKTNIAQLIVVLAAAAGVAVFGHRSTAPGSPEPEPAVKATPTVGQPPDQLAAKAKMANCDCSASCQCDPECLCKEPDACNPLVNLRLLTNDEFLKVMTAHIAAFDAWVESSNQPDDLTLMQLMERWLVLNPQHDPRLAACSKLVSAETKFTAPQPEYVQVRQPYTYSYGFRGRKRGTGYRTVTMTREQYEAQQAAGPPVFYGVGCAGGRCGR